MRSILVWFNATAATVCGLLGVAFLLTDSYLSAGFQFFCAALNAALFTYNLRRYRSRGSDRPTHSNHSDPAADVQTTSPAAARYYATTAEGSGVTIETVHEDMPILAHRAAYLAIGRSGIRFRPLHRGDTFGVDSVAKCDDQMRYYMMDPERRPKPHKAPGDACDCGYYAVPSDVDSWHGTYTVDLLVELSGKVIEHERGYRAEHQRVIECRLPLCPYCRQPVEHIYFVDGIATEMGCARHFPDRKTTTVTQAERVTGGMPTTRKIDKSVTVLTRADLDAACVVSIVDDES